MMLDGTDADGEWSDEEVVRSGSNTGVSETEAEDQYTSVTIPRPQSSLGIMTSRSTSYAFLTSDPVDLKEDPVTSILDRIDAEIEMIGHTPSLPSPPRKNGRHQNGSYKHDTSKGLHASIDNLDETDTGLGSTSMRGDEGSNPDKINGVAEIYSEACMTDGQTDEDGIRHVSDAPSDLDSVAAQQIDTKFKEIMRKKKDDPEEDEVVRNRPRRRKPQQGQGRSRVQFLTPPPQFRDRTSSLPPDLPVHPGKPTASLTPRLRQNRTRPSATMLSTGYGTDNESIRTEDFETKFNNLIVTSDTEKQPEIAAPSPRQGILSKNTRKKDISDDVPRSRSSVLLHASDSALNVSKPGEEDDDILKRLRSISNGSSPSLTSHAQSANNASQGSSSPRPRSLSPSRLSLRKQYTSGDLHGLWASSSSNSSLKTNWNDSFWTTANNKSINRAPTNSSRWSPTQRSSSSTFDEVESLNLSSRSSNDSSSLFYYDRGSLRNRRGGGGGGGGGSRYLRRESGLLAGGAGEGGIDFEGGEGRGGRFRGVGGYGDLQKRFLSRQSSTTSNSTSPSSGNIASSDTSHSSVKDMALAKILLDFLEAFGNKSAIGPADKLHLQKLTKQIEEWDSRNQSSGDGGGERGGGRGDASLGDKPKSNRESYPVWSENGSFASSSGIVSFNGLSREDVVGEGSKQHLFSEQSGKPLSLKKKRRRDLIIPDDEDSSVSFSDHKTNKDIDSRKAKDQNASGLMKSTRKGESKENVSHQHRVAEFQDKRLYGERNSSSSRNILVPSRSFNRSGSMDSNASPPDGFRPFSTSHAERVLMGLGFGGKEGFLPERFLRDWYSKLSGSQEKECTRTMETDAVVSSQKEKHLSKDNSTATFSTRESDNNSKTSDSKRGQIRQNVRQDSFSSSQLDEASTLAARINGHDNKTRQINEYLSALSHNVITEVDSREMRMRSFANSRQKSLPLYLETLSEEDEKNSRVPGFDPFDKETKLQMFISDVMSNSGKSTGSNSEQSVQSSNTEYDTQSSSSADGQNHNRFRNSNIHKNRANNLSEKRPDTQKGSLKTIKEPPMLSQTKEKTVAKNVRTPPKLQNEAEENSKRTTSIDNKTPQNEREVHFSTDSLEVADILSDDRTKSPWLQNDNNTPNSKEDNAKPTRNPMLKNVEPAMVSIVLEDVDEGKSDSHHKLELSRSESGRLSVPSSGSLSLSPIPQSPVTVIEVGLDNTQDSLDTEDGLNSSREIDNYSPQNGMRAGNSPTTLSCANCGNSVVVNTSRSLSEIGARKSPNNIENNRSSPKPPKSDRLKSSRERFTQKGGLNISDENAAAKGNNSSDESSFEGTKLQRESKISRNRSPNSFNRRRSAYSSHLSPCHSPSFNRHHKEGFSLPHCSLHDHHSPSSQYTTSLSTSPISSVSEYAKRRRWLEQSHAQSSIHHDPHWHNNKCTHHYQEKNVYDCHCSGYQHHHHPCQHRSECCPYHNHHHHHRSPRQSPKYEPSLRLMDYQNNATSISGHSSPGSAFRSPRKDKEAFAHEPDGRNDRSEISETDQEEFPSHVSVSLDPRPISADANSMLRHKRLSQGDSLLTNMSESFDHQHHQSPLVFAEESAPRLFISTTQNGKVHQISRAVQAYLPHTDNRLSHSSRDARSAYYLACDMEVQCTLGENSKGVKRSFNKFVQTHTPSCEVSCQTINDSFTSNEIVGQHNRGCKSKSINTVISLIGAEHDSDPYGTAVRDNSKPIDLSKHYELQLVDDTLDLIEMELVAINDKARKKQKTNDHQSRISRWSPNPRGKFRTSSNSLNSNPTANSVNQDNMDAPMSNRLLSSNELQPLPSQLTHQSANSNPETVIENKATTCLPKPETKPVPIIFDVEKEMSAYLKPCQGMYDGVSTPESFRSSPGEMQASPLFQPASPHKTHGQHNTSDTNNNATLQTNRNRSTGVMIKSASLNIPNGNRSVSERKSNLFKGHSTPIISVCEFGEDFLQIPSFPHASDTKARYPTSNHSSPTSSKSAPSSSAIMKSQTTTPFLEASRSYSLNDIPRSTRLEQPKGQPEQTGSKGILPSIKLELEVKETKRLAKTESMDINSDNSEMPRSSSRDSLTEVSMISSVDEHNQKQSLQGKSSLDSNYTGEVTLDSLHLPVGVEFSLSCPHSNWEGMHGHRKFRSSRIDRFLRTQTSGSDRFTSLYSMDALSDRSLAGSEIAQDIDEIEVMMCRMDSQECDSESSYSDLDNDFVDEIMSETSTNSARDEKEGVRSKSFLGVSGELFDLLQVSDCGESSPNLSRMSPSTDELGDKNAHTNKAKLDDRYFFNAGTDTNAYLSEKVKEFANDSRSKSVESNQKNTRNGSNCENESEINLYANYEDTSDTVGIDDPLRIDAPSVSSCQEINLDQLSSPDYGVLRRDINPEQDFPQYLDVSGTTYKDQTDNQTNVNRVLYPNKSETSSQKSCPWWPKAPPLERTVDEPINTLDGSEKHNFLRTFQTAEIDSLLNQEGSTKFLSLSVNTEAAGNEDRNYFTNMEIGSDIHTVPNAHVLSVETEDDSRTKDNEMDCFLDDGNIMDELEIIALFQNMEHLTDFEPIDFTPKSCSPYPLSEIPEEDTQSEESLNMLHRANNERGRTIMAQETIESVIEVNLPESRDATDTNFQDIDAGDRSIITITDAGNTQVSDSGHGDDNDVENANSETEHRTFDSFHSPYLNSPSPPKSNSLTTMETLTTKEELTYSSGLVYFCNSKSETTQKTTLNFDSPRQFSPTTIASVDDNDTGHMSTVSLTVGDYRKAPANEGGSEKAITSLEDAYQEDTAPAKVPRKQLVKTILSQSLSDDNMGVFMSSQNNDTSQQNERTHTKRKSDTSGKRLRSRESLLRLHLQKKCTGSDSDSETPQQAQEDFNSIKANETFEETQDMSSFTDKESNSGIFENFLTYDSTSFNAKKEIAKPDSTGSKFPECSTKSQNAPLSITRGVIVPNNETDGMKQTKLNPRVIVHQPSDDVPFWDSLSWRNSTISSPPPISAATADISDHHLHPNTVSDGDRPWDLNESPTSPSSQRSTKTGLWTRRANRSNFLSPNLALLNETFKDPAPLFRRDYASSSLNEESHPELDYLDLIPKFSGSKDRSTTDNHLSLPMQRLGLDKTSKQSKPVPFLDNSMSDRSITSIKENDETVVGIQNTEKLSTEAQNLNSEQNAEPLHETKVRLESVKNESLSKNNSPPLSRPILTNEEIDQFVSSEACDNLMHQLISITEPPKTSDSVEPSSYSKFVSAISRDSGFESRGSPIEHPNTVKGSQRKSPLFLSGVDFSSETV